MSNHAVYIIGYPLQAVKYVQFTIQILHKITISSSLRSDPNTRKNYIRCWYLHWWPARVQGSQGVIQDKGGIWGYLEQSKSLSSESLLGLQIDGKLQRLISTFENLCSEGKIPTGSLHAQILGLLGDARMIFNKSGDRRKKEQLMETLNNLHKNINDLLAKLPS